MKPAKQKEVSAQPEIPPGLPLRGRCHPWGLAAIISITLLVILYMGWAYYSDWYWYYGIDAAQLDLPLPLFFEQGMVLFGMHMMFASGLVGVFFILRLLILYLGTWFRKARRIELALLFSVRALVRENIHILILAYVVMIQVLNRLVEKANENYNELEYPVNGMWWSGLIVPLMVLLLLRALGDLVWALPVRFKQRLRLDSKTMIDDGAYRLVLGVIAVFASMMFLNGIKVTGEASISWRDNGRYQSLRQVTLQASSPIQGLEVYRQGCECAAYVYGPLAYVAINDGYIFVVPWLGDDERYFTQFRPLYQIERSETNDIQIIPFEP